MDPTGGILSYVINKLGDLILNEATLLGNTRRDLQWVHTELGMMQAFLEDAAEFHLKEARLRRWVEDVRKLSFYVEDVIDTFTVDVGRTKHRSLLSRLPFHAMPRHDLGTEIAQLRETVAEFSRRKVTYDIKIPETTGNAVAALLETRRMMAAPYTEDEDVVGLDRHIKAVTELLEGEGSRRSVVSIVGMGGLGKTTLTKKVYNNLLRSSSGFCCNYWVSVSQKYSIPDLLQCMAREMLKLSPKDEQEMTRDAIREKLCEHLRSNKYLIVLDDVWSSQVWDTLCKILPDTNNGSRIIITTRIVEVARLANPNMPPYELLPLDEEQSRVLFTKRAFPNEENAEQRCSGELASLREKIVNKCGGLPLAIIVVGALLSAREKSPREWRKVAERIEWHQTEKGEQCMGILALSYVDLPFYLKWCFLYLAAIPEDCEVHAKRLMRMWIAEGFVKEGEGESSLEETAERYLEELANRCLIQVVERTPYGSVELCRVHDLILDVAVSEAKKIRFLDVWKTAIDRCPRTLQRRLSFTSASIEGTTHLPLESNKLRTLLIMHPGDWKHGYNLCDSPGHFAGIEWSSIQRNLKLLRVLELGVFFHRLPDEIENMVNLRYLSLSSYIMKELPKSLGNLRHLQTLDLGNSFVRCVPVSIWRIKTLRYLHCRHMRIPAPETSLPINGFQDLRALRRVRADPWMQGILPKLSNLRELEICRNGDDSFPDYLCGTINSLRSLEVLVLSDLQFVNIFSQRDSHPHLHTLELSRTSVNSSKIQELPRNLKQVTLSRVRIQHGLIELLGKLPSLHLLSITHISWPLHPLDLCNVSIVNDEMIFKSGWFPRLHVLRLEYVNIKRLEMEAQSLPLLRKLEISCCSLLQALPESLPPLKELEIVHCPRLQAYLEGLRHMSTPNSSTL